MHLCISDPFLKQYLSIAEIQLWAQCLNISEIEDLSAMYSSIPSGHLLESTISKAATPDKRFVWD